MPSILELQPAQNPDDSAGTVETLLKLLHVEMQEKQKLLARAEAAETLAFTDPLTGLSNRRAFNQDVAALQASLLLEGETGTAGRPVSMIICDIDKFKSVNDIYGHDMGDRVLKHFARVIDENHCDSDIRAARFGGEEFALILPGCSREDAMQIADKLGLKMSIPLTGKGDEEIVERLNKMPDVLRKLVGDFGRAGIVVQPARQTFREFTLTIGQNYLLQLTPEALAGLTQGFDAVIGGSRLAGTLSRGAVVPLPSIGAVD